MNLGSSTGGKAGNKSVRRTEAPTKSVRSALPQRIAREATGTEASNPRGAPRQATPRRSETPAAAAQRKGQKLASEVMLGTFGALAVVQLAVGPLTVPCDALARPAPPTRVSSGKRGMSKQQQTQQTISATEVLASSTERATEHSKRVAQYPAWDSKTNPLAMTATPGTRPPDFPFCRGRLSLAERCNAS